MSEQRIRVLHITASSTIGGGPEHVWQLIRHLPAFIENFVAAPTSAPYGQRFIDAVGQECFLTIPQRKFTLRAFLSLLRHIKKHRINIIHSHGKGAGIYGRLAALCTRVKSVHTFHGIHLPNNIIAQKMYARLEKLLCGISKVCIAVSAGEAQQARILQWGAEKLAIVYNGVVLPKELTFRKRTLPLQILHVSRFDTKQKNSLFLHTIAQALQEKGILKHCQYILVGDGEELPLLKTKNQSVGFDRFFQYVGRQDSVLSYYEQSHCYISTSRWEGLPLAVLEAQAHGLPCIVSDVVGNRDALVHEKTGFLFPIDDAYTAAEYIEKLLQDEKLWQSMRSQAHTHALEHFSAQTMAKHTVSIYNKVCL